MTIIPAENGTAVPAVLPPWATKSSSVDFVIDRDARPVEAIEQARKLGALMLPGLIGESSDRAELRENTLNVLIELVDLTARHPASPGLLGRIEYDGQHVTVSVGDMGRALPTPEEEPGLYLVQRLCGRDIGQYAGDRGGRVTWAAVQV
ncbi:hypothetical protein ACWDXD_24960 [Streptomyces sp. NPDC003314]